MALSVKAPSRVTAKLSSSWVALSSNGSASLSLTLEASKRGNHTVTVTGRPEADSSTTTSHSATTSFAAGVGGHTVAF